MTYIFYNETLEKDGDDTKLTHTEVQKVSCQHGLFATTPTLQLSNPKRGMPTSYIKFMKNSEAEPFS